MAIDDPCLFIFSYNERIQAHGPKLANLGWNPMVDNGVARIFPRGRPSFMGPQGNPYQTLKTHRIRSTIFGEGPKITNKKK